MSGIGIYNLKVLLQDSDFYALQAVNSYLAWDRRTRVTYMAETIEDMWEHLYKMPTAELPDVVVIDPDHVGGADALYKLIKHLQEHIIDVQVICMAQFIDDELVGASVKAGVKGYFLKRDVRYQIAWAIIYAVEREFVVTHSVYRRCQHIFEEQKAKAYILPESRTYPELTLRIRQAIQLCVIEGMPAHLAADEMGISLHTIRGYIKEGYRILEAYDETEYPLDMTPQERAFMRFTALDFDSEDPNTNTNIDPS
jgi:DNA-binding NarL/FixJ family response regulator